MKKIFILLMVVGVTSCNHESESVSDLPGEIQRTERDKKADANAQKLLTVYPSWKSSFTTDNRPSNEKVDKFSDDRVLFEKYIEIFGTNDSPKKHWSVLDKLITADFNELLGNDEAITPEEVKLTRDVQWLALTFIQQYLLREIPSQKIADRVMFYLNVLHKHKAVDLNTMTDALIYASPYISLEEYNKFGDYLLNQAEQNVKYAMENWEAYEKRYRESEGLEKNQYLLEGRHLAGLTEEAEYVRATLGVAK